MSCNKRACEHQQIPSFHFLHRVLGCGGQFLCDFIIYWFKGYVKNYTLNISDEKVSFILKTTNSFTELLKIAGIKMKIQRNISFYVSLQQTRQIKSCLNKVKKLNFITTNHNKILTEETEIYLIFAE
jgi:hypothetical protein